MADKSKGWKLVTTRGEVTGALAGLGLLLAVVVLPALGVHCFCASIERDFKEKQQREREASERARAQAVALDEAERKQKADEVRRKAEFAAAEAARTPADRAALAIATLADKQIAPRTAACRAHELLDSLTSKDRAMQNVKQALDLLGKADAPLLAEDIREAEEHRTVVCADGAGSSCACMGKHRGCCSHHGGIVGCQPLPTKVACPVKP